MKPLVLLFLAACSEMPSASQPPVADAGIDTTAPPDGSGPHALAITTGSTPLTSWDFGNEVTATTSAALALTITNDTDQVSDVLSVNVPAAFPIDAASTCASQIQLAPGASCALLVRFRPTVAGVIAGDLIADGGPAVGQATITLSGTGVAAADLDTEPPFIDFGPAEFGTTTAHSFLLNNRGGDVTVQSITIGNPIGAGFSLQSTNCIGDLLAAGSCDIDVAFAPSAFGQASGDLTIVTDHGTYTVGANWVMGEGGARLTVQKTGNGSVVSDGGGVPDIDCGATCSGLFVSGADHQLTASTNGTTTWGGDGASCTGSTCAVTLSTNGPTIVTATFTP